MRILILEDEKAAATRLQELVLAVEPGAAILAVIETVAEAVAWLTTHPAPDIILSDIQLADGLGFEVFNQVKLNIPVIFTTAYDAYTLKAFKLNSIDYLLKPIDQDELQAAFAKYRSLRAAGTDMTPQITALLRTLSGPKEAHKSRFMIRQGDRLTTIPVQETAFIKADDKVVFLHTLNGQKHIIEDSLDELEQSLDPVVFFRLNRTYITPLSSIDKIQNHFNGRLKITLHHTTNSEIYVSRARVPIFKKWLDK